MGGLLLAASILRPAPALAHDVTCFAWSDGDLWVWGSAQFCNGTADSQTVTSTLYKWNGSNYDQESFQWQPCGLCANVETIAGTPPGTGWRWVEGQHYGYHHNIWYTVTGMEFYRP